MTSGPRSLSGSVPGQLDASQPSRLLRLPGSRLAFASFHPGTASAWREEFPDLTKLSLNEELYRPKRVVIETTPEGESFWRFVPKAKRDVGVEDEGLWPRLIEICGEVFECSQDQWDVYKLDPEYDCIVQAPPQLTVITRIKGKAKVVPQHHAPHVGEVQPSPKPKSSSKRRFSTLSPDRNAPPPIAAKKMRGMNVNGNGPIDPLSSSEDEFADSGDEDEVQEMIIDGTPRPNASRPARNGTGQGTRKLREELQANRTTRRERIARRGKANQNQTAEERADGLMFDLTADADDDMFATPKRQNRGQAGTSAKRKDTEDYDDSGRRRTNKRARTRSPTTIKRELAAKKSARQRRRNAEKLRPPSPSGWEESFKRYNIRTDEKLAEVPEEVSLNDTGIHDGSAHVETPAESEPGQMDEEAVRLAAIEESRRKLAALEQDRPIWEEAARQRSEQEKAENEARQRAKLQEQKEREREQRRSDEQQAARRREQEAAEKREREDRERRRRQQRERWSHGPWTSHRALERYKVLSEAFDNTKFSPDTEPLTFESVPWPILHSPISYSVEDIDWSSVEKFFTEVRRHMRSQDYKEFVQKSHRRFHPDRWRSRRLFDAVVHDEERGELEVAANTIAQAITPIWREVKDG